VEKRHENPFKSHSHVRTFFALFALFAGIQMVFCGDFAQLPFVTKRSKERVFAFETDIWKKTVEVSIVLDHVYRQDDREFVEVLRHIRMGHCPPEVERVLLSRRVTSDELEQHKDVMRLFPLRRDVLVENRRRLEELPGDLHEFIAKDWGNPKSLEKLEKNCAVDHWIGLKEGCFVVLLVNLSMSLYAHMHAHPDHIHHHIRHC
jgi:ATP-dependent DNA helicase PIF1